VGFGCVGADHKYHVIVFDLGDGIGHCPEPNTVARPATVALCQYLAQWSTLFVPTAALMNSGRDNSLRLCSAQESRRLNQRRI
jgi:hypothetical protein